MYQPLRCIAAAAAILASTLAVAPPPETAKPLRHLRFSVSGDARTRIVVTRHGFNETGTAPSTHEDHATPSGTIDVDVTGVMADGSIAVRIAQHDDRRPSQAIPAGIFPDGYVVVSAANAQAMNDEELVLLPLLGPSLFAGHDATPGATWTLAHHDGTIDHTIDVRVDRVDGTTLDAALKQSILDRGAGSLTQTATVTLTYDDALTVPLHASANVRRTTLSSDRSSESTMAFSYVLLEDSLRPPKP